MPDSHTIAENLTRLTTARTNIATAITTKGGTVAEGAGLEDFPTAIGTIPAGGSATLITKNINANGTYNASSDDADGYSSVTVAVPNTYSAGDEGKVVSNGSLVAQTARPDTITTNGNYITTNYNSVTVNVPTGGGTREINASCNTPFPVTVEPGWINVTLPATGSQFWTDGQSTYYSNGVTQKGIAYNSSYGYPTLSTKTWTGMTEFYGIHVWSDGENIYYSVDATQKVLNVATSTWGDKTWTGLTNFTGQYIWTDGTNIYYSNSNDQYVLDTTTSTWSVKNWTGLTNFIGERVWSDGENIYYSNSNDQYVLDTTTSTWSVKNWGTNAPPDGSLVWSDGTNIYYSGGSLYQWVLNKTNSVWESKTWLGASASLRGDCIVRIGTDIFFVLSSDSQKLRYQTKLIHT